METTAEVACIRGLVAIGACTALVLPGPASAQVFKHRDTTHDVAYVVDDNLVIRDRSNKTTDIKASLYRYSSNWVTTKVWLRNYEGGKWEWSETIDTLANSYAVVGAKRPGKHLHLTISRGGAGSFRCAGMSGRIFPVRAVIRVTVPARCLARPHWARVGLWYVTPLHGWEFLGDDPLDLGLNLGTWESEPTPWLHRL